jgi:thiol-disulfide isomerase/thioredoxin
MKIFQIITIVLFSSLFGVSSTKGGVVITGQIKGNIPSKIEYTNPVNSICYIGFRDSVKTDSNGNFRIKVEIKKPTFVNLLFNKKISRLIVEPGKSYNVNVNNGKVNFTSPDSLGQQLINTFPSPVIVQMEAMKLRNDTSLTSVAEKVAAMKKADLDKLAQLFGKKQISRPFYDLAKTDRDCYYSTFMAIFPLVKLNPEKPSATVTDFWGKIFQDNPPGNDSLMSSPYWNEYIQYYIYYKEFTDKDFSIQKLKEYRDKGNSNTRKIEIAEKYLPQSCHEYFKAATIYFAAVQKDYEKELISLYKDFEGKYPGSAFSVYLKPLIDPIEAFHRAKAKDFSKGVTFVNDYEKLNTLKECIAALQGKKIFIDVWATWCGPCKAEFGHKENLKQILKQKDIQILYISIDDDARDQQWKDMIKYYNLDGYHLRAN